MSLLDLKVDMHCIPCVDALWTCVINTKSLLLSGVVVSENKVMEHLGKKEVGGDLGGEHFRQKEE